MVAVVASGTHSYAPSRSRFSASVVKATYRPLAEMTGSAELPSATGAVAGTRLRLVLSNFHPAVRIDVLVRCVVGPVGFGRTSMSSKIESPSASRS